MGDRQGFNVRNASHKQIQYFFQKNLTRNAFLGIIKYVGWAEQRETQRNYKVFLKKNLTPIPQM